jgi:hypothetical protein
VILVGVIADQQFSEYRRRRALRAGGAPDPQPISARTIAAPSANDASLR